MCVVGRGRVPGSHDCRLVVWDALTGTWLAHMEVHIRSVTSVVWLESDSTTKKKSGKTIGESSLLLSLLPCGMISRLCFVCLNHAVWVPAVVDVQGKALVDERWRRRHWTTPFGM